MCFGLNNIDWGGGRGRGAVLCIKNCNDPLKAKTTCVPTTSESDCTCKVRFIFVVVYILIINK
jgi:hypothetical protein